MAKIIVYGRDMCTYCQDAKKYFTKRELDFEYIEATDEIIAELEKSTGIDTIPQIFVNDKFVGGWLTTKKLIDEGKFDDLLD